MRVAHDLVRNTAQQPASNTAAPARSHCDAVRAADLTELQHGGCRRTERDDDLRLDVDFHGRDHRSRMIERFGIRGLGLERQVGCGHNLLDVAHIESGQFALDSSPTSMKSLLTDVFEAHAPQADSRGITLRLDMPAVDTVVEVDRDRIIEVLGNLLSNALKFTARGATVTLLGSMSADFVTIAVADTGSGIPADQLDHIFERFTEAAVAADRECRGLQADS